MGTLLFLLKILLMPAFVCLMALPLFLEYLSFRKDKNSGHSHKRFRLFAFSVIYFLVITIVMLVLKDLLQWVSSWSVVTWLCNQLAVPAHVGYSAGVFGVMLINTAVGFLFWLLLRPMRIGMKKRDLLKPSRRNGTFTWLQKLERRIVRFFYHEKWFFAARILLILCIGLALIYSVLFLLYQLPVYFSASWIPYAFLSRVFAAGYLYPVITLIPLCQAYFFLSGVEELQDEYPELVKEKIRSEKPDERDLTAVNEETQKVFRDYFRCQFTADIPAGKASAQNCHEVTKQIAEGILNDVRNPGVTLKDGYLNSMDAIVRNDLRSVGADSDEQTTGVLVNGGFFTEFSQYFLRYISVILSRGDNVVFACNNEKQIDAVYECVEQALIHMYSLYQEGKIREDLTFDDPIWKLCRTSTNRDAMERARMDECSVLVTDVAYLCSRDFEVNHVNFANLIDTVVFVDALHSVNSYGRQMSMFVSNVKHIRDLNALRAKNSSGRGMDGNGKRNEAYKVRYTSKQIKYVCFDDSRTPGLDKVLKNLLAVNFETTDAMQYAPKTTICCYNYERGLNEGGLRTSPQLAKTNEELGVLVNMADFALQFGAGTVSLFAQDLIPYADLAESVSSNANNGVLARIGSNFRINHPFSNTSDYRVIVAFDEEDNLPAVIRRYASMAPEKETLVLIFSRAYLLRDYYLDSIEQLWRTEQQMRIPVERSGRKDTIQQILVQANAGGIFRSEIFRLLQDAQLPEYKELLDAGELNGVLRKMLLDCGIPQNNVLDLYRFFEYKHCRAFDKDGQFISEDKICLRKRGALYEYVNSLDLIRLVINGTEKVLPLPRDRITQNFVAGQNLLYDGAVYTIDRMNALAGKMYVRHATGGRNSAPYQYLQDRVYYIDWSDASAQRAFRTVRRALQGREDSSAREVVISVYRRPMEVVTQGYTILNPRTLARNGKEDGGYVCLTDRDQRASFQLCYRKYGVIEQPVYSADSIVNAGAELLAYPNGALVMSVKIHGDFGENGDRIANLAAAMLSELLHSMFPTISDSLAVCPVVKNSFEDAESKRVLRKQYKAVCRGREPEENTVEVLIIEDCASDLGAISVLMSSGDDTLGMLFNPVRQYLQWYAESVGKSDYLYFGNSGEPACFDFAGLTALAELLGDRGNQVDLMDSDVITQMETCDFCGRQFAKGADISTLPDGRKICKDCEATLAMNDKKTLKEHLNRARMYLESIYGITLVDDCDVCFETAVKISNTLKRNKNLTRRGADLPFYSYVDEKRTLHVECDIPVMNLSELLVRELTHVWQLKNLPELDEELAEGHIALVGIQYLRFLNQTHLASTRSAYYESSRTIAGEGYRKLISALVENPGCSNNPFLYLLRNTGGTEQVIVTPQAIRADLKGSYGLSYTPAKPDRALDGKHSFFYYDRLKSSLKETYDIMLDAIQKHRESTQVSCTFAELQKVSRAIRGDHPELFWYNNFSMYEETGKVMLLYGATREEADVIQQQLDAVIPGYLEGIDDSMSAYDVALRIHLKLINTVDYDTLKLREEEVEGHPKDSEIDRIRTICGVFLDGKAVCAGYARAAQYLLQKCGVECAYASGDILRENGEKGGGHAWNILKVDGDYYYMDTTWDDSSDTVQSVKNTDFGFDYFCITTEEVTRTRDLSTCPTDMPKCIATRANYYHHNGAVMSSYDPDLLITLARKAAENQQGFFTFKCTSRKLFEKVLNSVCTDGKDTFVALKEAAKINKKINASSFSYGYDKNIWTVTIRFKTK